MSTGTRLSEGFCPEIEVIAGRPEKLVRGPMASADRRPAAQANPDDEDQCKYHARANGDALQKINKKRTDVHFCIVPLAERVATLRLG
jgi:hypothetical protein